MTKSQLLSIGDIMTVAGKSLCPSTLFMSPRTVHTVALSLRGSGEGKKYLTKAKVSVCSCSVSAFPGSDVWLLLSLRLVTTPSTALSQRRGCHSPVYDGHDVHNPEADPEHEVARGQDVEEDHQAGSHHSVPRPSHPGCHPHSVSLMSVSNVCVSGSGRVITVTTGHWLLVTSVLCTVVTVQRPQSPVTAGAGWGVAPVWNKMQC